MSVVVVTVEVGVSVIIMLARAMGVWIRAVCAATTYELQ